MVEGCLILCFLEISIPEGRIWQKDLTHMIITSCV